MISEFKKTEPLKNYAKTQAYYTNRSNDIYIRLKPYLVNAITNAGKIPCLGFDQCEVGVSQMHKIFGEIDEIKESLPQG